MTDIGGKGTLSGVLLTTPRENTCAVSKHKIFLMKRLR